MNAKELKGLSRSDLLELLLAQTERVEQLEQELEETRSRADARDIMISKSGTLAEASMQINQVWKAADQAAAQYLGNVMRMYDEQLVKNERLEHEYEKRSKELLGEANERCRAMELEAEHRCRKLLEETAERCRRMEQDTRVRCDETLRRAQQDAKVYWDQAYEQLERYCAAQESLKSLLGMKG